MCTLYTASELSIKTDKELSALFRKVSQDLAISEAGSNKRISALASLENISKEMSTRRSHHALKPPGF
ncbi:MAG: hypothetical protein KME37_09525 [Candidatus Thiodiazotropha sp. (ex Codakia orbicularis)]|nr:hypothetical protein [Candidatus Thiodiazotropha sp. (ex Codakia orbicularis)]